MSTARGVSLFIGVMVWAAVAWAASDELYRGTVELAGGARLVRALHLAPDGSAELVSEYSGGKPTVSPATLQQYGALLRSLAEHGRLVHKGSWREINGRITVYLTTLYAPAARPIQDTLVLLRRGEQLDAVRYDRELYGAAGLHFSRAGEPAAVTLAYPGSYRRGFTGAGGPVEETLLVGDNRVVELTTRYPQGSVKQLGTWITDGRRLLATFMLKDGRVIQPEKITFELQGDTLAAVEYDRQAHGPGYAFQRLETAPAPPARADAVRVERGAAPFGPVVVTVAGQERRLTDHAASGAWMVEGGKAVLYAARNGAGGDENAGRSLYRYDIAAQTDRRLVTAQHPIRAVAEVQSKSGRPALLLEMSDAAGAPHAAIVAPERGLVWRHDYARFGRAGAGQVAVELLPRDQPADGDWSKATPFKIEALALDPILRGKVLKP